MHKQTNGYWLESELLSVNYYLFMFSLCRCDGSCNSVEDPSGRMSIPNIIKDVNWEVFNITRWINGSKTSMNYTSCEYRCKFDGKKFKPKQKWNKVSVWVKKIR